MEDLLGQEISVGKLIIYPTRMSAHLEVNVGLVTRTVNGKVVAIRFNKSQLKSGGWRVAKAPVLVSRLDRSIIIRLEDIKNKELLKLIQEATAEYIEEQLDVVTYGDP